MFAISHIAFIIYMILYTIMMSYLLSTFLRARSVFKRPFFSCSCLQISLILPLAIYKPSDAALSTFGLWIILFVSCLIIFDETLVLKISAYCFLMNIAFCIEAIPSCIFNVIGYFYPNIWYMAIGLRPDYSTDDQMIPTIILLFSCCLTAFCFCLLIKTIIKRKLHYYNPWAIMKINLFHTGITLMMNILFFSISRIPFIIMSLIYCLVFIICSYAFECGLSELKLQEKRILQKESNKNFMDIQLRNVTALETDYVNIQKWNHDISNHLSALTSLIGQQKDMEAIQYIDSLLSFIGEGESDH